ncbi:ACP S-malonyltransferase [Candidatus Acidulodesulfobacterium sp. H_13]|uniref:ACP S-malonyltransferase n=1 Tax=Candidatus Acidulodesulfobacterium sp. H_13 TaxID=3395470 RepID=UPI003AF41BC7
METERLIDSNIAFIFPGQGSQHVGMGRDIFENFGEARHVLEESSDTLGINMKKLILGDDEGALNMTENTQPAILTVSMAMLAVMRKEYDIKPVCTAGHSLGEYGANVFAGSVDFYHALLITKKRGFFMQNACPPLFGKMAAIIGLDKNIIKSVLSDINGSEDKDGIFTANFNSPIQIVISGLSLLVDEACALLKEKGAKRIAILPVSAPFHTPFMEEAKKNLSDYMNGDWFSDANCEIFSNVTSLNYSEKNDVINFLLEQMTSPVRWSESVLNMIKSFNVKTFIEIGPSNVLSGLIKRIDKNTGSFSVNSVSTLKELEKKLPINSR